jgi:site-specific DNA-adenine methylase
MRPALRWHGGKWRVAPWIISHFPPHRIYIEPFGVGASGWSSFAARRSARFSDHTPSLQPVVGVDIGARLRGIWG